MGRRRRPNQPEKQEPVTDAAEADCFLRAVADVRPLPAPPPPPRPAPPPPLPLQRHQDELAVLEALGHSLNCDEVLESGDEWLYLRSGLSPSLLRDLRRGRFRIQERLDLHGCTVEEARTELAAFLREARQWRWTCVCVVHGKGLGSPGRIPVLKRLVGGWLMRHREVLAFAQARPEEGGSGALRVLLGWPRRG